MKGRSLSGDSWGLSDSLFLGIIRDDWGHRELDPLDLGTSVTKRECEQNLLEVGHMMDGDQWESITEWFRESGQINKKQSRMTR